MKFECLVIIMESAATVEEEKSNLKERMEAYREQMDVLVYVFITMVCRLRFVK